MKAASRSSCSTHAGAAHAAATAPRPAEAAAPVTPGTSTTGTSTSEFDDLFRRWRETGDPRLRERLILMHRSLVIYLARRFSERSEMAEDVIQQGFLGMIQALDHFDPSRGVRFSTFATPTIIGEIRRYFRDRAPSVRLPRRLHELQIVIAHKIEALSQELDRSPTYSEIARSLGLSVEEVVEVLEIGHIVEPMSLDDPVTVQGEGDSTIGDQVGAPDADLEQWGQYAFLEAALEQLPTQHRQVLELVYFEGRSQSEVAQKMKVSQMHISRVQRSALKQLRELLETV